MTRIPRAPACTKRENMKLTVLPISSSRKTTTIDLISSLNYGGAGHSRQPTTLSMSVIMMMSSTKYMQMYLWRSHDNLTFFNTNCLFWVVYSYICHICVPLNPLILHTPTSVYYV